MIDLLSRKTRGGDLYINLAQYHLASHEWGKAKIAIEQGMAGGCLSEPEKARVLWQDICQRVGVRGAADQ